MTHPLPEFVALGHMCHDIKGDRVVPGGSVTYSTLTALEFSKRVGAITSRGPDFKFSSLFSKVEVISRQGESTTTFENIYSGALRKQTIKARAENITKDHIPKSWQDVPMVHICPVANEVEPSVISSFKNSTICITPQGWMRRWDDNGVVYRVRWVDERVLKFTDIIIVSEEDIKGFEDLLQIYKRNVDIVIVTRGERGAALLYKGKYEIPAFKTKIVDPTGAGDVFSASFLVKYWETSDPYLSLQFAVCAASFCVEAEDLRGLPNLVRVAQRLKRYQKDLRI